MDTLTFLTALWRGKWIILLTTVLAVAACLVGIWLLPPRYEAVARFQVPTTALGSGDRVDYADLLYAERLMNTYARIAASEPLQIEVTRRLGLATLPKVEVEILPDTELMQVTVVDSDPQRAADSANMVVTVLAERARSPFGEQSRLIRETLLSQINDLDQELVTAQREISGASSKEARALAEQTLQLKEDLYTRLREQYEQSRVIEAVRASALTVVDVATAPGKPSGPHPVLLFALAAALGLLAGIGLALLVERLSVLLRARAPLEEIPRVPLREPLPEA